MPSLSTYLVNYRVGDIVDIKANASEQKGLVSGLTLHLVLDRALTPSPTNVSEPPLHQNPSKPPLETAPADPIQSTTERPVSSTTSLPEVSV